MWHFIFTVIFVSLALPLGVIARTESNSKPSSVSAEQTELRKKAEEEAKHWLKVHIPVSIYGKVVDQNNAVVPNAEVDISWREPTLDLDLKVRSAKVKTDDQGTFTCGIEKGIMPIVRNISKDGYEFLFQQNPVVMLPMEDQGKALADTSREKPIVLVMRKKGEMTFLLSKEGQLIRASALETKKATLDILKQKGEELSMVQKYQDIAVEVAYSPTDRNWTVTYSATNGTDGLIVGTNLLYEAPQEGYQRQVVLNGPLWPKYLYLRTRTPAIYSRLNLEHSIWKESKTNEGFRVNYKAWINPYGSRNLEYESGLAEQWQLRKQLEREAKTDLLQNKRPLKPDLPKLIKDAKDKDDKDKSKQ